MARSSQDRLQIRRRLADPYGGGEPEEGELVLPAAGYHSDADTEEYYNSNAACPSDDSEETISDSAPANYRRASPSPSPSPAAPRNKGGASTATSAAAAGASSSAAAAAAVLACPFCGKEFRNHKAVCGHMKVHREQGGIGKVSKGKGTKRKAAAAVGGWGGTGKRGCSGSRSRAASPESMAVVVPEPKIVFNPMPLAFAAPNLSPPVPMVAPAKPKKSSSASVPVESVMTSDSVESCSAPPMRDDAMDTVVEEAAANPPTEAAVHHQASPPPPPPAAAAAGATEEQASPVPQQQPVAPPPPGGRQDPKGYTCKRCGMWFRTHQGLGGHIVGHKNRELAVAAALDSGAGARGGGARDAKAAGKAHACKVCGKEFAGGLQLGGHMRKHWAGEPFNKKPRRAVPPLALALSSVRAGEASSPAPRPAVPGRVLLFGIDIGAAVKTPPATEQGSPATEATAAPSTSGGGEQ